MKLKEIILASALFFIFIPSLCAQEIRDVKPPVEFPPNKILLYSIIGLAVAVLTAVLYYFIKQSAKARPKEIVPLTPWDWAYQRLNELRSKKDIAQGNFKEFYSELSDILRRYIEERFFIRAPEMTTEEFLFSLQSNTALTIQQKKMLQDFLNSCDMVKFAKHQPQAAELEISLAFVKTFIDQTRKPDSNR